MAAKKKLIVRQNDPKYPDTLYMADSDDFRLADARFGWTVVEPTAKYDHKNKTVSAGGKTYRVFPDWSLKAVS